jgi:hypothetical protein
MERYPIQKYPIHNIEDAYLTTVEAGTGSFPASRIQKGLVLGLGNRDLSEEGVGFGLPVLKIGSQPLFPGSWRISTTKLNELFLIKADFEMNLRAEMARKGKIINNGLICQARDAFSRIHQEHPRFRNWISVSSRALKKRLDIKDVFSRVPDLALVSASYLISDSGIDVKFKFPVVRGCTEIIILNEQGANCFDTYKDSDGLILKEEKIGSWDQIKAKEASFIDPTDGLMFSLKRVQGTKAEARMFRGRELAAGCLAWSGLAYVLPPETEEFAY